VILLTGWGRRLIAENDVPACVDRVLSKPPRLIELRTALAELTGGERQPAIQGATQGVARVTREAHPGPTGSGRTPAQGATHDIARVTREGHPGPPVNGQTPTQEKVS
jgi:hypothetical protein